MGRRGMLGIAAAVIGTVVGLIPLASGLLVFLDPLLRKKQKPLAYRDRGAANTSMVRVATLDQVPDDGVPRRFPVVADQIDAWNYMPAQAVGAVWIRREKGAKTVQVLHATCPHAGCSVSFRTSSAAPAGIYHCPCHNSAFGLSGAKLQDDELKKLGMEGNPSPRDMDPLEYDAARLAQDREVWVRFVNYYSGVPYRRAKS